MKINFKGDAHELISQVQKQIRNAGGYLQGSNVKGQFKVKGVKGNYKIEGETATINITDKPWIVSTEFVEDKIREFFK